MTGNTELLLPFKKQQIKLGTKLEALLWESPFYILSRVWSWPVSSSRCPCSSPFMRLSPASRGCASASPRTICPRTAGHPAEWNHSVSPIMTSNPSIRTFMIMVSPFNAKNIVTPHPLGRLSAQTLSTPGSTPSSYSFFNSAPTTHHIPKRLKEYYDAIIPSLGTVW